MTPRDGAESSNLVVEEQGDGRTVLILHGGGGPETVAPVAAHLAASMRALIPTHPGWEGTEPDPGLETVTDLARAYLALLEERDARDVVVVGSSLGGWVGAEMAVHDEQGRIGQLVLLNPVGIWVDDEPVAEFFALSPREATEHAFHDADSFYVDPAEMPADVLAVQAANMEAMRALAGDPYMHNPALREQLGSMTIPTLVVGGASDRITTPSYSRAYAESLPNGSFALIEEAGHLPHLERPEETIAAIDRFLA